MLFRRSIAVFISAIMVFTIEMKTDWNAAKSSDFDRTLIIPSDSKVTLNMHGRVFSRNNSWDKGDE